MLGMPPSEQSVSSIDLTDVVDRYWPYDGPHTPEKVAAAAVALSGLVRYLNNATRRGQDTLPRVAAACHLISELDVAVSRLPQMLSQLYDAVKEQAGDPTLYDDRRDRPGAETAETVLKQLALAGLPMIRLTDALNAAAQAASHLGNGT